MSHALYNELNEIPMPEGLEEREDDVHDLQFGYDVDVDEDDGEEDDGEEDSSNSQKPAAPESDVIKEILIRQAEAIEKLASGIQEISQTLQHIAMTLAQRNLPRMLPPPPPPPPVVDIYEVPDDDE